ncbi:MAG: PKD domain-containing protein [Thermoplasmatota archaeon]
MNRKMREKVIVGVAAVLFFAAFGAVAYLDRSHGTVGDDFGQDDFTVVMERNQGHLALPEFPSDLLIFAAEQEASLDFTVTNNDQDNDIDTVYITIPDGEVLNATAEWYDPLFTHEWDFTKQNDDVAKVSARDDLPGRVFGGSAQYDVAGNIDDALDHNSNLAISEGITITLDFLAPDTPGTRMGSDAINLQVSDEQTETEGPFNRYSVAPFPYPYLVIDEDYEFLLFELSGTNADLDIEYGGTMLFGSGTRASDFQVSEHGFKYRSSEGSIVTVLEAPTGSTIVNPVIRSISDGGGQFTLSMVRYLTGVIDPGQPSSSWVTVENAQNDYTGQLPMNAGDMLELDIDGDGLFTDNDDDIDGDGIPNDQDTDPYDSGVTNHHPVISDIVPSASRIPKNKDLELEAIASDADGDSMTYSWAATPDTGWTGNGATVIVDLGGFEPGTYTFTVTVSDGEGGNDQATETVEVTASEEADGPPMWMIVLIIVVILAIVGAVVFYVLRGGETEEEEIPEELAPQPPDAFEGPEAPAIGGEEISEDYGMEGGMMEEDLEEGMLEEDMLEGIEGPAMAPPTEEVYDLPDESEMQEVQDLEALIDEMERTEEEIGDVCPECSAPLGPYDSKCGNCGAEFELALECPNCGAVIEEDTESCPGCGVSFQ